MKVKSTLGLEAEFLLIDKNGRIVNTVDKILEKTKKRHPEAAIIPEIAENMIEFGSQPSVKVSVSAASLLENIHRAVKVASEEKTLLLPMGTYPGKFNPKMRDKGVYGIKKKIFGEKFDITGRCVGFHLHHALPEGSFDATSKNLKAVLKPKTKKSLVEAYNLSIALDPVLTTFLQSSPFYQGQQLGKDSRMIVYRGGNALGYEGVYSDVLETFGELPTYQFNESDLLDMVIEKYAAWKKAIRDLAPEGVDIAKYDSVLHTAWNPVKINPHGTIELRGMDMNMPSLLFRISAAVKYLFQEIYERSLHVVTSKEGVADYFMERSGELHVPPYDYVSKKLQYLSAYTGMDNEFVHNYCKSFLKLAKSSMPNGARKLLLPFQEMVDERQTTSDNILKKAKKLGYDEGELSADVAEKLALDTANKFLDDLEHTHDLIEKHKSV